MKGYNHCKLYEIRNIAAGVFPYSSSQESTQIDGDSSDDNTDSLNTVEDSSDEKEYSKNALINALVAWTQASEAELAFILAEEERFKSRSINASFSITECVTALDKIEDVTDDIYMKACEKFMDPDWREMFLAMPSHRRKGWLVRL
jgi:hypothetical protein